jgi:MOSC domain-containing protein YiiM
MEIMNQKHSPQIFQLSVAAEKGDKKHNVDRVEVACPDGIVGDAHAGSPRPISLLPFESFQKMENDSLEIAPGDFAENITTIHLDFQNLKVGTRLALGNSVILDIIQIGKECHEDCVIKQTVGDCIMPREGVFAKVIEGGILYKGDTIKII